MEKIITYCGQRAKVGCDERCDKAWGINERPRIEFGGEDDPDDYAFLSDDELGLAPENPGTGEGGDWKPINKEDIPNKWCVRECERCAMSNPGEWHKLLELPDYSKRRYNDPSSHLDLQLEDAVKVEDYEEADRLKREIERENNNN